MLGPHFPGRQVLGLSRESKTRARPRMRSKLHRVLPELEPMQRRRLFAAMVWAISTGGNWEVAGNWVNEANSDDHHVPTATDDAVTALWAAGIRSRAPTGGSPQPSRRRPRPRHEKHVDPRGSAHSKETYGSSSSARIAAIRSPSDSRDGCAMSLEIQNASPAALLANRGRLAGTRRGNRAASPRQRLHLRADCTPILSLPSQKRVARCQ